MQPGTIACLVPPCKELFRVCCPIHLLDVNVSEMTLEKQLFNPEKKVKHRMPQKDKVCWPFTV